MTDNIYAAILDLLKKQKGSSLSMASIISEITATHPSSSPMVVRVSVMTLVASEEIKRTDRGDYYVEEK